MSLTITSINVNGIRAAVKERSPENLGLLPYLAATGADVVCLQEMRADLAQAEQALAPALDAGWVLTHAESETKGRNGVAILTRTAPDAVRVGFGRNEFAASGRYLEVDLGGVTVGSLYLPSGEVGTPKQDEKDRFRELFGPYLLGLGRKRRDVLVCGDWNIGPETADIKNWKGNRKNSGFLPEERDWVRSLLDGGFVDVVRQHHAERTDGPYSWWSWRGKAFDNDSGWRIDYHLVNRRLAGRLVRAEIERPDAYALRWSDHAPVTVEFE